VRNFFAEVIVVAGTADKSVRAWNVKTGVGRLLYQDFGRAFTANDNLIAGAIDNPDKGTVVTIADLRGNRIYRKINIAQRSIQSLALSRDGKSVATMGDSFASPLSLWETRTGQLIREYQDDTFARIQTSLAFSEDCRLLVSSANGSTINIFSLSNWPEKGAKHLQRSSVRDLISSLRVDDASVAYRSIWTLVAVGENAIENIKTSVKPVPRIAESEVIRVVTLLDHDAFAVREKASARLREFACGTEAVLHGFLASNDCSPEQRVRLKAILERAQIDQLFFERIVTVLEYNGTRAARDVLIALASGAPDAFLRVCPISGFSSV
jgi:WD40 repeat protein